jgi:hypothetical protein
MFLPDNNPLLVAARQIAPLAPLRGANPAVVKKLLGGKLSHREQ